VRRGRDGAMLHSRLRRGSPSQPEHDRLVRDLQRAYQLIHDLTFVHTPAMPGRSSRPCIVASNPEVSPTRRASESTSAEVTAGVGLVCGRCSPSTFLRFSRLTTASRQLQACAFRIVAMTHAGSP